MRLFVALWPDGRAQEGLDRCARQWHWPEGARRYARQDWHVTLHFLGNVPSDRLEQVRAGLAVKCSRFELTFDQPEIWHRGLAVLCPSKVPDALLELHANLAQAIGLLGLPVEERVFRPHLTLARQAMGSLPPKDARPVHWQIDSYVLACSTGDVAQRYRGLREYCSG